MTVKLLPLPIAPRDALRKIIRLAWKKLPAAMSTAPAEVFVLAVMLQDRRWRTAGRSST